MAYEWSKKLKTYQYIENPKFAYRKTWLIFKI